MLLTDRQIAAICTAPHVQFSPVAWECKGRL